MRRRLGFGSEHVVVAGVGRLVPVKGFEYLVEAHAEALASVPAAPPRPRRRRRSERRARGARARARGRRLGRARRSRPTAARYPVHGRGRHRRGPVDPLRRATSTACRTSRSRRWRPGSRSSRRGRRDARARSRGRERPPRRRRRTQPRWPTRSSCSLAIPRCGRALGATGRERRSATSGAGTPWRRGSSRSTSASPTRERPHWRLAFAGRSTRSLSSSESRLGVRIMVDGYSPVPFADFWDQFPFIERGLRGEHRTLDDFLAQHNEHRIALARLQFLVDYGLFDGTNVFLFGAIAARESAPRGGVRGSPSGSTRATRLLALGALSRRSDGDDVAGRDREPHVVVPGRSSSRSSCSPRWRSSRSSWPRDSTTTSRRAVWAAVAVAAVAGVAATYSMANGLFVWPIVVAPRSRSRLDRRRIGGARDRRGCCRSALVSSGTSSSAPRGNLSDPVGLVHFVAVYLGSVVWGAGSSAPLRSSAAIRTHSLPGRCARSAGAGDPVAPSPCRSAPGSRPSSC